MAKEPVSETNWTEVAAKAQAYQAMHLAGLNDKDRNVKVTEKAEFLMVLGLSRSEAAGLIGSTDESLRKGFGRIAKKATAGKPSGKASADGE